MRKQIRLTITLPDHTPAAAMEIVRADLQAWADTHHNLFLVSPESYTVDALVEPDGTPAELSRYADGRYPCGHAIGDCPTCERLQLAAELAADEFPNGGAQ